MSAPVITRALAQVQPWRAGSVCPEKGYADFVKALIAASHHYADDSGKEWGQAKARLDEAVSVAIGAAWPYWAIKRMYAEIAPLPSFDHFMGAYLARLFETRGAA